MAPLPGRFEWFLLTNHRVLAGLLVDSIRQTIVRSHAMRQIGSIQTVALLAVFKRIRRNETCRKMHRTKRRENERRRTEIKRHRVTHKEMVTSTGKCDRIWASTMSNATKQMLAVGIVCSNCFLQLAWSQILLHWSNKKFRSTIWNVTTSY